MDGKQTVARTLGTFVGDLSYEKLPDEVRNRAKSLLLNALGHAIVGRELPWARIAVELATGCGNSTVFTHNTSTSAPDAAFANAVMVCGMNQDDQLLSFHPGQVNVPTAIAVAEQEDSSGAEAITAMVAGYEVMGRVFLGGPGIVPRFRGIPAFGPFGAAVAAGKLLGLSGSQLTTALGYAANLPSGLTQCVVDGTMETYFHGGVAARNGIVAATLARAGATATERSIDGPYGFYQTYAGTTEQAEMAIRGIGERFLIMETSYKPYPICGLNQIPVDVISRLVKQFRIRPSEIDEAIVRVAYSAAAYPGVDYAGPFETSIQAILSAQFCGAATFLEKPIASYEFCSTEYQDPGVFELARKIRLIGEKDRGIETPRVEVILKDGTKYSLEGDGEALVPTDARIRHKFRELTSGILGARKADDVIDTVTKLDKCLSIKELTRKLEGVN